MQKFEILFENDDFCIVNKPKGLITHASLDKSRDNLFDQLKKHYQSTNKEVSLLHRLDKETSGLILFSLNPGKNKLLQQLIEKKELQKTYVAQVHGNPSWTEETVLKDYVKKVKTNGMEKMVVVSTGGDVALAKAKSLAPTIVQVTLVTGRMHQIRLQLASRGFPILGDELYGKAEKLAEGMHLHSAYLGFNFEGKMYSFLSPPVFFKAFSL